jgi:hypothetical protein
VFVYPFLGAESSQIVAIVMTDENSGFIELTEAGYHTTDDGCKIYFETHGSGPQKIVLIQGTPDSRVISVLSIISEALLGSRFPLRPPN